MPYSIRRASLWLAASGALLATASAEDPVPTLASDSPSGLVVNETENLLTPDEDLSSALSGSLAGETRSSSGLVVSPAPLFDNERLQQTRVAGDPSDPLSARRKTKSKVSVSVRGGVEYNDNIFATADDEESDVVAIIAPTLSVNAGDFRKREATYLSAAYTATGSAYLEDTANDTLDHLLEVGGQWKRKRLTIPYDLRVSRETGAFLDIGGRDTAESYGGRVGIDYAASSKVSFGLSGEYSTTDYSLFADFESAVAEAYVGYNVTSKLTLNAVYRYSDAKTDGSDGQSYQAALVRVNARPNSKVTAFAEAGLAFSSLGRGDRNDLIYRAGVAVQPTSKQRITFEAVRQPSTSSFTTGSGYINNGVQLRYEQALGARSRVVVTGGYEIQDYFAADEGVTTDREDDYFVFSSLLAYDLNAHWQAQVYYTYANNDSSDPLVEFDNQRVGMGLTWTY